MDIQYYYELVVKGIEAYWRVIVVVGGVPIGSFIVSTLYGVFSSKVSGGTDWTKN